MSATTILESYDTQMHEDFPSGDFDVAMQTAGSSTDIWFQGESIMDQDGHHDSLTTDRGSVEVEMDETYPDADHESVECEMADEAEYQPQSADLLDVEVYDASQLHSPAPIPAIPASHLISNDGFTVDSTSIFPESHNPADPAPTHEEHEDIQFSSDFEVPAADIAPDAAPRSDGQSEAVDRGAISAVNHSEPSVDLTTVEGLETADETLTYGSNILDPHPVIEAAEPPVSDVTHPTAHVEANTDNDHEEGAETLGLVSDLQEHEAEAHIEGPQQPALPVEDAGSRIADHDDHHEPVGDETTVDNDPHEISDGIYIDPPPPVLLSLQLSESEHSEVCLFNQPSTRVGSRGSEEDPEPSKQATVPLLLHHRPTLYYEPLVNVFEALRQEEYITQTPEFAEGELVLDAYDLQLVISEVNSFVDAMCSINQSLHLQDNVHAREVTLHDLNVIHDGSDLQGPLRMHLHLSVPRFIFRYHTLRDQIARLNLVAEGEEEEKLAAYDHRGFPESSRLAQHNHRTFAVTEEYHDEQEEPEGVVPDCEVQQHEETPEAQTAEYKGDPATETLVAPSGLPQDLATGDNTEPAPGDHEDAKPNDENDQTVENYPEDASTHTDNVSPSHDEEFRPVQHAAHDDDGIVHPDHAESIAHDQATESTDYNEQCFEESQDADLLEDELVLKYPENADDDVEFAESGDADSSLQQTADGDLQNTDVARSLAAPVGDDSHGTVEGISQFHRSVEILNWCNAFQKPLRRLMLKKIVLTT